jgi:hypothetical protein
MEIHTTEGNGPVDENEDLAIHGRVDGDARSSWRCPCADDDDADHVTLDHHRARYNLDACPGHEHDHANGLSEFKSSLRDDSAGGHRVQHDLYLHDC